MQEIRSLPMPCMKTWEDSTSRPSPQLSLRRRRSCFNRLKSRLVKKAWERPLYQVQMSHKQWPRLRRNCSKLRTLGQRAALPLILSLWIRADAESKEKPLLDATQPTMVFQNRWIILELKKTWTVRNSSAPSTPPVVGKASIVQSSKLLRTIMKSQSHQSDREAHRV